MQFQRFYYFLLVLFGISLAPIQAFSEEDCPTDYAHLYEAELAARTASIQDVISSGNYRQAVQLAEGILKEDPRNIYALGYLSKAYWKMGQTRNALRAIERQLEVNPENRASLVRKFEIHFEEANYSPAIWTLRKMIALFPNDQRVQLYKGQMLLSFRKKDEALKIAETHINNDTSSYEFLELKSKALLDLDRYEEGSPLVEELIQKLGPKVNKKLRAYWVLRNRARLGVGRYQEVLDDMDRRLDRFPDDSSAVLFKAQALAGLGRAEEADEFIKQLPADAVDTPRSQWFKARLKVFLGNTGAARAILKQMIARKSDKHINKTIATAYIALSEPFDSYIATLRASMSESDWKEVQDNLPAMKKMFVVRDPKNKAQSLPVGPNNLFVFGVEKRQRPLLDEDVEVDLSEAQSEELGN